MAPHGTDDREQDQPPRTAEPPTSEVTRRAFLKTVGKTLLNFWLRLPVASSRRAWG